jgi:hypothetical protein
MSFRLLGIPQNKNKAVTRINEVLFSGAISLDFSPDSIMFLFIKEVNNISISFHQIFL